MEKSTTLRTAVELSIARALAAKKAQEEREWAARFDTSAWRCRREGKTWIAEGPREQVFQFGQGERPGEVVCLSSSGREYLLTLNDEATGHVCSCPDSQQRARETGCKHLVAFAAVKVAHRAARLASAERMVESVEKVAA